MKANDNVYVTWLCNKKNIKKNNNKLCLKKDLVSVLLRKNSDIGDTDSVRDITVTGIPEQLLTWTTVRLCHRPWYWWESYPS